MGELATANLTPEDIQLICAMLLDSAVAERARHDNFETFRYYGQLLRRLHALTYQNGNAQNTAIANYTQACFDLAQPIAQMQPWLREMVVACQVNRPIPDAKFTDGERVIYGDETEWRTVEQARYTITVHSNGNVSQGGWAYYLSDSQGGMGPVEEHRPRLAPPEVKPERPSYIARKSNRSGSGYVYLLNEINGPHWKIGRTRNPDSRSATFGVTLPYKVEYAALIQTADMYSLEAELHARFAEKRVNGEWFALEPADVAYVKSLAVQS